MTLYSLVPHPAFPPLMVSGVDVEVRYAGEAIALTYRVAGAGSLIVPAPAGPDRTDGLWKTTCFELFVKAADGADYAEFNFAPSGQWAAFAFDGYRAGMRNLELVPPRTEWADGSLTAYLRHPGLVPGPTTPHEQPLAARGDGWPPEQARGDGAGWAMALAAVIEEEGGRKSYWSLAHPPGAPDFHHEACFAATLPAPDRA